MVQDCPRILHTRVTCIAADPVERHTLWAGVEIDGIFQSGDLGRSWQPVSGQGLSSRDIHALAIVPGNGSPKRILAATNNDLNISKDNGQTWEPLHVQHSLPWNYCRAKRSLSGCSLLQHSIFRDRYGFLRRTKGAH